MSLRDVHIRGTLRRKRCSNIFLYTSLAFACLICRQQSVEYNVDVTGPDNTTSFVSPLLATLWVRMFLLSLEIVEAVNISFIRMSYRSKPACAEKTSVRHFDGNNL